MFLQSFRRKENVGSVLRITSLFIIQQYVTKATNSRHRLIRGKIPHCAAKGFQSMAWRDVFQDVGAYILVSIPPWSPTIPAARETMQGPLIYHPVGPLPSHSVRDNRTRLNFQIQTACHRSLFPPDRSCGEGVRN